MIDGRTILRTVMARKGIKTGQLADDLGEDRQTFANWMQYNKMRLDKFSKAADMLGCDVVLLDRETGDIYK